MEVTLAPTLTASRLNRHVELSALAKSQGEEITAQTIAYCHAALERSRFFGLLRAGAIAPALMQYTFLQYHHWRNRLHQWFGLCIVKAENCTNPDQESAILSLADHIFTDLQDGHNQMYLEFLHELGLQNDDIAASKPSAATLSYGCSFSERFGYGTDNFYEALAALSGRELCASIRNVQILQSYFDIRAMKHPIWLSLHAEVEADHFQDTIRPVLTGCEENSARLSRLLAAVQHGVDRHFQYFEDLLQEYESQAKCI